MKTFGILALLLLAVPLIHAQSDGSAKLASGDAAFLQMDYPTAVSDYEEALEHVPGDPVLHWRLARAYVCIAEVEEDAQRRVAALRNAETHARECLRKDSRRWEGHTWLAAALGYLALEVGMQEQINLSRELLEESDRALAINPKDDIALSIRGSFFRALGNVGWFKKQLASIFVGEIPDGGFAEAERALLEAVALAPDIMRHKYELGVLYLDMGRASEACAQFQQAARLPVRVAIDRPRLAKIRGFLEELNCEGGEGR
jgi:tetratricopeptide (TPR) repeat protein